MTDAIVAHDLVKTFPGGVKGVDGLSLTVAEGSVVGLLGPNGAGKTTAVRILTTLLRPDAGTATVGGFDVLREPDKVRSVIGLTGQYTAVDELLSGTENLSMIGRLSGLSRRRAVDRAAELLRLFDLAAAGRKAVKTYSGGMRRRLDLAASLVLAPRVLFLDEPTTGLDPRSRALLWELIRQLVAAGTTVLLTTQYLDEADQLADHIAVVDHGRVVAAGSAEELKLRIGGQRIEVRPATRSQLAEARGIVAEVTGVDAAVDDDTQLVSAPADDPAMVPAVVERLTRAGIGTTLLALRAPSLDEVFLALTNRSEPAATTAKKGSPS